jgi:membrane protein DedA with SNARE-associated domain
MSDFFQLISFSLSEITSTSPYIVFFVFFFATFVSEDAACLTAGALAGQGKIGFSLVLAACFAGIFTGDVLLYWTGRFFGRRLLQTRLFSRFVSENAVSSASVWLEKRGAMAIFLSRFVTGLRLPTYLAAGFLRTNFWKFAFYFLIASIVWTPILVGSTAFSQKTFFSESLFLGIILSFIGVKIVLYFLNWENRRHFVGRVKRIINWEFWPLPVFYFPVAAYILFLGVKHRSLTIFTCANTAIPASGFVGESKNEIYEGLLESSKNLQYLLAFTLLKNELPFLEKQRKAEEFIARNNLSFPLALKPDVGERGKDVEILHRFAEIEERLSKLQSDHILQEFAGGVEASIFYYRYPGTKKGKIFSITEKRFPTLKGDGKSSLKELILRDKRAVALAQKYFEQNSQKLNHIFAENEEIQIINIGTHSRGAVFLDGEWLKTQKLENKIDEICRGFTGFYFGRFDLRAKSFEDLQEGINFKIIELNGVTSESTNIYDPKFSLFAAYQILFSQWRIAFEIGAENQRRGAQQTGISDLIKLIFGKPLVAKTRAKLKIN